MTCLQDRIDHPAEVLGFGSMPPDPVGLSEIAEFLGVSTRTVERYAAREDLAFPVPAVVGGRRIWNRADVEKWARQTLPLPPGRPPGA